MRKLFFFLSMFIGWPLVMNAQIGQHRDDLTIGVNGGYILSSVSFNPKVVQSKHGGLTGGLTIRYTSEKYFSTICSLQGEINYAQVGWKDNPLDANDQPVINKVTGVKEEYSRTINYIQIPLLAHLAWGKEGHGAQFFINLGPQLGAYLSESTKMNFDFKNINLSDRANTIVAQDTMAVEKKFDYGIVAGAGLEYTIPKIGHFLVEARYYYGLGNLYGDSKRDYFGSSNLGNIVIKMSYLFDIRRTKK